MSIATPMGATTDNGVFDAADAFLKRIDPGAAKPPKERKEEAEELETEAEEAEVIEEEVEETPAETEETDDDEATEDDEPTEDDDDEPEEKPSKAKKEASDDVIVKVKVDGKEHEVSVADLKRLYGQEKSLTRKSQEVATERKKIEEISAKQVTALTTMFQRAQDRAKPYQEIDFLALAKDPNFTAEDMTTLRREAERAFADVNFYGQELDQVHQNGQKQRQEALRTQAIEAHKVLNDPTKGIKGWSQAIYDDIRHYAIGNGLSADVVNSLTDPHAIKMLHKAMQFDKGQQALAKTTKVVKTAKKVIKTSSSETSAQNKPSKAQKAQEALRKTGSIDAAQDVFLSRMLG